MTLPERIERTLDLAEAIETLHQTKEKIGRLQQSLEGQYEAGTYVVGSYVVEITKDKKIGKITPAKVLL